MTGEDVVLEIGAGLGFLTRELAQRAHRVIAVEIDARLYRLLGEELPRWPGGERVCLVHSDVLAGGGRLADAVRHRLAEFGGTRSLRVVANVPYAITGPVLAALSTHDVLPASMALLIQREVAQRLVANPGGSEWGSLSAVVQAGYEVRVARQVGREVFRPRPNVDSTVVVLTRRAAGLTQLDALQRTSFAAFVRALFGGRRRKIRHSLEAAAAAAGAPLLGRQIAVRLVEARPVELNVADLIELWRTVTDRS